MKLLFEDNPYSVTSQFIKAGYSIDIPEFTGSNSELIKAWRRLYKEKNQHRGPIVLYIDVVPDNIALQDEYRQILQELARSNKTELAKWVFVIPIPCIEFYFIKAFMPQEEEAQVVLELGDYRATKLYQGQYRGRDCKKFAKSFEKYCKVVLDRHPEVCKQIGREGISEETIRIWKSRYYKNHCYCYKEGACKTSDYVDLNKKACLLLQELPVAFSAGESNIARIERQAVEAYNNMVVKYAEYGYFKREEIAMRKIHAFHED